MKKCNEFAKQHGMEMLERDDATPSMYINDISKVFNTTVGRAMERMDISHGFRRILFHLAHNDGMTQLQLVKLTHLTAPTISVALAKLESDKFVIRKTDEKDMRQVRVYLTEKGREHDNFVRRKCRETEEIMLKGITKEEQEQLCDLLKRLLKNLVEKQ